MRWFYTILGVFGLALTASAEVPQQIHYNGYLTNGAGEAVDCPNPIQCIDTHDFSVRFYASENSTAVIWDELHPDVPIFNGSFHLELGSATPITAEILSQPLWLSIKVNEHEEMLPRQKLVSAAYAIRASSADQAGNTAQLGGQPAAAYATQSSLTALSDSLAPVATAGLPADLADGDNDLLASLACSNGQVVQNNSGSWSCVDAPPGPSGPQGPQGPEGPEGEDGSTGAQGPQGVQGPQGNVGATGSTGPQGPQGNVGTTGAQGVQGPQGSTGPQGDTGAAGSTGAQGAQGPQGPTGPQGEDGSTGAQGAQGPQGPTGPQGEDGSTGAQGAQGPQGPTGPQGDTGAAGADGPQGPPGISGYQIVTNSITASGHFTVAVFCGSPKKVISGGCNQGTGSNRALINSNPIGDIGWECRGRDISSPQTVMMQAFAICANVQ